MPAAPLTSTHRPREGERLLVRHLEEFFLRHRALAGGDRLLVGVSGGADSLALLWGLTRFARRTRLELRACHLDHGLDPASGARAAGVAGLCAELDVELIKDRRQVGDLRRAGESPEAAARRVRYGYLEEQRRRVGARWLLTAHHADDQVETLLLRLLYGSGLGGLGGIAERRGPILRPLLGLSRRQLRDALAESGLAPLHDPTNDDLQVPRNLVRHRLIPALEPGWPSLGEDLRAVARTARGARRRIDGLVQAAIDLQRDGAGMTLDRHALRRLPRPLWTFALARAGRLAGLPYPPRRDVRRELRRQLDAGGEIGCDQGDGWRWRSRGERLGLEPAPAPEASPSPFCRSFQPPGQVELPQLGLTVRLRRAELRPWMLRGAARRTGLGLRLRPGETVRVRSRRPGDRLKPLGCDYRRRLKDILIDHQVPRRERDLLPLLEVGGRIVWVPGVTVDNDCRLAPGSEVWLAEIEST